MADRRERKFTFRSGPLARRPQSVGTPEYIIGDQVLTLFPDLRDFTQAVVLSKGINTVRVLRQDGGEEIVEADDLHFQEAGNNGVLYQPGVPVLVDVHVRAARQSGIIVASLGVPDRFVVTLDADGSTREVPLNNLVFFAGEPPIIPQVDSNWNVKDIVPDPTFSEFSFEFDEDFN
ncbi:hypothetical protein LCGC14_0164890 [marine sediment metagenome]|uniref:Uncharacterized protein n=1 Tax=marine sediment metagenome TaxID=412755 RepID=A0A0F9UUY5_9ZZZZ